jgi:hypothetical protein
VSTAAAAGGSTESAADQRWKLEFSVRRDAD